MGGVTFLYGQMQSNDSDDGLLFRDADQAREGEEAVRLGVSTMGSSLVGAGMGLALLVAGIALGRPERPAPQQQQQVVVVTGERAPPRIQ